MRNHFERIRPYTWTILLACITGYLAAFFLVTFDDLPEVENLQNYTPKGITVLMDSNQKPAHEYYQERRVVLTQEDIPEMTKKAFLVAEDWNFYQHFGIDLKGIARAMVTNLVKRKFSQGASTITQQLSRNLFLTHKKTIRRKLKEIFLTLRIERKYTKDEIMTLYLNQIYLGEGAYGIEQAAKIYFGKSVQELNIEENALLAALPKNPNIFSPFKSPERALSRRNLILEWMFKRDVIDRQTMLAAKETNIPETKQNIKSKQNYFTYGVFEKLQEIVPPSLMENGRMQIASGYDVGLQKASEDAVAKGIEAYRKRHKLKEQDEAPQMATLSMDIHTGEIRSMVGGADFQSSLYNRAFLALRQPGSSIKPLLYALALDRNYTQSSFLLDAPIRFDHPVFGLWEPENYDGTYHGFMPLRRALEMSKNTVAVRLLQSIGIANFQNWLAKLGIGTEVPSNLTIALGSASVYLPQLAQAYATFGNGGYAVEPTLISRIEDNANKLLFEQPKRRPKRVMSPVTAFLITDALTGVVKNGTARFANNIPCALAGKTGTTNQYIDSVFVGYSSELVTVVWVGFDDNRSLGYGESGSRAAGRVWKDIMAHHCAQHQPGPFLPPSDISWVTVDHETGLLPNRYSINLSEQAYRRGSEPTKSCCVPDYDLDQHLR